MNVPDGNNNYNVSVNNNNNNSPYDGISVSGDARGKAKLEISRNIKIGSTEKVEVVADGGNATLIVWHSSVLSADNGLTVKCNTATLSALNGKVFVSGDFSVDGVSGPAVVDIGELTIPANGEINFLKQNSPDSKISVKIKKLVIDASGQIKLGGTAAADIVIEYLVIQNNGKLKINDASPSASSSEITINNYLSIQRKVVLGDRVTVLLPPPVKPSASVAVTPKKDTLWPGAVREFTAVVTIHNGEGGESKDVMWRVAGGNNSSAIDQKGVLTVGASETKGTTLTVTATSKYDSAKSDSATVTVADRTARVLLSGYDTDKKSYVYALFGDYPQSYIGAAVPSAGVEGKDWLKKRNYYYSIDAILWRVLDADGENSVDPGALMLSDLCLDRSGFGSVDGSVAVYESSVIRKLIVERIFQNVNHFSLPEKGAVRQRSISQSTDEPLFLLSASDLREEKFGFNSNQSRIAGGTAYMDGKMYPVDIFTYWLRTPSTKLKVWSVDRRGRIEDLLDVHNMGVRPALVLNLESLIFKSNSNIESPNTDVGSIDNPFVLYAASADLPAGSAEAAASGSGSVTVSFGLPAAHAYLDNPDTSKLAAKFTVSDGNGDNPINGIEFVNGALVLKLARNLSGAASFSYAGYSASDTDGIGLIPSRQVVKSLAGGAAIDVAGVTSNSNTLSSDPKDWTVSTKETEQVSAAQSAPASRGAGIAVEIRTALSDGIGDIDLVQASVSGLSNVRAGVEEDESAAASTRGAASRNLLITGTAADDAALQLSEVNSVSYWLKGDHTEYRQSFSPSLKLADMAQDESFGGGSSGGCGTGAVSPLAVALLAVLLLPKAARGKNRK